MTANVIVRTAVEADHPKLAALRWVWSPPPEPQTPELLSDFTEWLTAWMTAHRDDVVCKIAVVGEQLVGMAWLAVYERIPNPGQSRRITGDVQSVFVLRAHRGHGIGRLLMSELCAAADELGIPSVSVRSSPAAAAFYERLGFARSPLFLERSRPASSDA
jgi:GNAT superfamily N-acetyltransferase